MMTRFILGELWAKRLGLRQCRLEQKNDCMVPVAAIGGMRWNSNLRDALVRMGGGAIAGEQSSCGDIRE